MKNGHSVDTFHMKMSCATALFLFQVSQAKHVDKTCMSEKGAAQRNASHMSLLVLKTRILSRIPLESYICHKSLTYELTCLTVSPAKINMCS